MKQLRHILFAITALLALSCPANEASAQALLPPQTVVGNIQATHSGASALTFNQLAVALSQTGYLISSSPISLSTAIPPTPGVPGNAVVFGPLPYPNVIADAGQPPLLAPLANVSLATMPAGTIKSNVSGGSAAPSDNSISAVLDNYTTSAVLTTTIPADDTIPQSTEGTQILSVNYTPKVSTSKLRIDFQGQVSSAGASGDNVTCAVFNGGASAIAANMINITSTNFKEMIVVKTEYSPGSTSAQTITARCGGATANIALNGNTGGGRLLGGSAAATLEVREIQ